MWAMFAGGLALGGLFGSIFGSWDANRCWEYFIKNVPHPGCANLSDDFPEPDQDWSEGHHMESFLLKKASEREHGNS